MTRQRIILLFSLIMTLPLWGQPENSWTKKNSFAGLKREKAIAFSINEFGYVGCGIDTAEITHNDLWQYDPNLDTWTQLASIPGSPRRDAVAFAAGGMGYVGTGFSHDDSEIGVKLKDFWAYDPDLNSWEGIADYPGGGDTGLYHATAFSIQDKGYVACGKIGSNAYISEMWQYNPELDQWTEKTPFSGGERYQLTSFVVNEKAYVGFGTDHDVYRKDLHVYDPVSNTWETLPDFPGSERAKPSGFSIGNKGFIVFGTDGGFKDELWEYNSVTHSWSIRAPFPGGPRTNGIAFSIGDKGYAGIGKESDGKKQSFYEYKPKGPLSIEEKAKIELNIYPMPIEDFCVINLNQQLNDPEIFIFNIKGELVQIHKIQTENQSIDLSELNPGSYILQLQDQSRQYNYSKKIIVQ